MSKASKIVAGAMLIGVLSATPLAQAKGIGGPVFSDVPAAATTQVLKYSVSWFSRWLDLVYRYLPIQPTQPERPW